MSKTTQFQVVSVGRYCAAFVGHSNQRTYIGSTEWACDQAYQKARALREFGPCRVEVSEDGNPCETVTF